MSTLVLKLQVIGEYFVPSYSPVSLKRGQTVRVTQEQAEKLMADDHATTDADGNTHQWFTKVEGATAATAVDVDFTRTLHSPDKAEGAPAVTTTEAPAKKQRARARTKK